MQDRYQNNGMSVDEPPLSELEEEYNKLVEENNETLTRAVIERLSDETMFLQLSDNKQKEIVEKVVNAVVNAIGKVCERIHDLVNIVVNDIIPPLYGEFCKYSEELLKDLIEMPDEYYEDEYRRVYHLARFAPKARTRKKNRARLFEMIKALYRPGLRKMII